MPRLFLAFAAACAEAVLRSAHTLRGLPYMLTPSSSSGETLTERMVFSTGSQARKGMYSSNMSASSYDRPRIWSRTRLTCIK